MADFSIKLSVITAVYNGGRFIDACIKNVIEQGCSEVEHVIMDGGSTDGTVDIIREHSVNQRNLTWRTEKDHGQSDALNKGVMLARGDVIGILNADDYFEPGTLKRVIEVFRGLSSTSFIVGNCNIRDERDNLLFVNKPQKLKFRELMLGPAINPFPMNPSAYFYHKSIHDQVGFFDVHDHYAHDVDFLLRVVRTAEVKYYDETWGNFRMYPGTKSIMDAQNGEAAVRLERVFNRHYQYLSTYDKFWLAAQYFLRSDLISGLNYYFSHPNELPVLIGKIQRVFGMGVIHRK